MKRSLLIGLLVSMLLATTAAPAWGAFGFGELGVDFEAAGGEPDGSAGSHPFAMTTTLGITTEATPQGETPTGEIKDLTVAQIPGFVGSQTAVPTCELADFNHRIESRPACPDDTAVGYAGVEVEFEPIPPTAQRGMFHVPVYNLTPPPGSPAQLGFVVLNVAVTIDVDVNQSPPYNLVARLDNVSQALLVFRSEVTLWGNPASPAHDSLRGNCLGDIEHPTLGPVSFGNCPISHEGPEQAFLTLPRACTGPLSTLFDSVSWLDERAGGTAITPGMTGCGELGFSPTVDAQPTTSQGESSTGLRFDLDVDDEGLTDPTGRAQSDIHKVLTRLPAGMTLNPSAAEGLGACSMAQYEAESLAEDGQGCPESSKLGTAEIVTPLLADPVHGAVYLAEQDNNPFRSTFAIYLVIKSSQYGLLIKQAGRVDPDPDTGQVTTTFAEVPQLPFAHLTLQFHGGPGAPLVTPAACGSHQTQTELTPWAAPGSPLSVGSGFDVGSGPGGGPCPAGAAPLHPGFTAGTLSNAAGSYSPFVLHLQRGDGEQDLTRVDATLPPGLVARLAGIPYCPEAAIAAAQAGSGRAELAAPSCPAASQIGTVLGGAGVGSALTWVGGKVYLAGPFAGDPLSIVVVTPAVAGPFDLGDVVVREGLAVDPRTAQVTADGSHSTPIPRILEGIPLDLRDLRIRMDRPDFTINPTSCEPLAVGARIFGGGGAVATVSNHFQAAGCGSLKFRPKLKITLKGATRQAGHPALRALVTFPKKGNAANIRRAQVNLPHGEFLDQGNINKTCTKPVLLVGACPKSTVYGKAKAWTPLLEKPLEGNVYLVGGYGYKLPALVADLDGQIRVTLAGKVDSGKNHGIRNTFEVVPDAPVSRFVLEMKGGKKYGLLENSENLCKAKKSRRRAIVRFTGQNGKVRQWKPVVANECGKKHRKAKKAGKSRKGHTGKKGKAGRKGKAKGKAGKGR